MYGVDGIFSHGTEVVEVCKEGFLSVRSACSQGNKHDAQCLDS